MKSGEYLEKVVASIEEALSPDLRIEHDVMLPVLNSPSGAQRQCDLVIYGKGRLSAMAIVEVQDRVNSVDINTFDGWCTKMRDVGAQYLFCVSRHTYPNSVQEKANKIGPSVRLMVLNEEQDVVWPVELITGKITLLHLEVGDGDIGFGLLPDSNIPIENVSRDPKDIMVICDERPRPFCALDLFPVENYQGTHDGVFSAKVTKSGLSLVLSDHVYPIAEINFRAPIKVKILNYEMETYKYVAKNETDETLAWTLEFTPAESYGNNITVPLTSITKGEYILGRAISSSGRPFKLKTPIGVSHL